ncbi:Charged multivesicular body 6 [Lecanosticta acicola]|uniref:Charged multivesicular body 6 n=1 Tax=Lecanosticta acicola TaxID=111012 RepID=A0AAI9E8G9_9PEZI|nr:Charged multivesicular body 6 [Lecanosticta acicola]
MGNSSSSNKISAQDRAILDLKIQRDKLHQYQKRISIVTTRETEIARQCLRSGNKQKALLALRRKKYQESLLAKTDQQLAQLQALTSDVEFALVQKDVLFGLQQGTAVLKEIHKEMGGLDKVEMILGESEEAQAYQKEINEMLSGKMSNEDEDEVEDELEAMAREAEARGTVSLPDAPSVTKNELPDAPQESPEERARRRRRERASREQDSEPIAA